MQKVRVIVDVFREQARSYRLALGLSPDGGLWPQAYRPYSDSPV